MEEIKEINGTIIFPQMQVRLACLEETLGMGRSQQDTGELESKGKGLWKSMQSKLD